MSAPGFSVYKFGGSSLGSADRLLRVIEIIASANPERSHAVVVSAIGDTTERLIEASDRAARGDLEGAEAVIDAVADRTTSTGLVALGELAKLPGARPLTVEIAPLVREHFSPLRKLLYGVSLLRERTAQTLDLILSFGERISAELLTTMLETRGLDVAFVDARLFVVTDDRFGDARVDVETTRGRLEAHREEFARRLIVTTGFTGKTLDGRTTTLGRNGSDYTASLLAWGLGAHEVVAWTESPGVMTADPSFVADAYPLTAMTYMEALELANFGARMFHPSTMMPLIDAAIPMRIKSTLHPDDAGTRIDAAGKLDEGRATSVTSLEDLALLGVQWRSLTRPAQVGERVLRALADGNITTWMENQTAHGQAIALVVPRAQVKQAVAAIERALEGELTRGEVEPIAVRDPVTLLTLVGEAMGRTPGVLGRFFQALGAVGVNVHATGQGASSRSISCVVSASDTPVAVRTVHAAFNFAHQHVNAFVLGKGIVGRNLLEQIRAQGSRLQLDHDVDLRVVGIADSRRVLFDEQGLDLATWKAGLDEAPSDETVEALLDQLCRLPVPVLVDCTAAEGQEALYRAAFERGIHVVAANKKPLAIPWREREELMAEARLHHRAYHYETTVGASLPIIETLKNLVRTGDTVRRIEGAFSGTLGYLCNEMMGGRSISKAVRSAKELGYTEPNPQDDLSGLDVARKALILARELGYAVELSDLEIKPLVAPELLAAMPPEVFLKELEGVDASTSADVQARSADGYALRYLARIEPGTGNRCAVRVGPTWIPPDHPATLLRGSEAFVAFTTERFADTPIIVQGSGAGGAVTAAGVLADVLRVAQNLRGR